MADFGNGQGTFLALEWEIRSMAETDSCWMGGIWMIGLCILTDMMGGVVATRDTCTTRQNRAVVTGIIASDRTLSRNNAARMKCASRSLSLTTGPYPPKGVAFGYPVMWPGQWLKNAGKKKQEQSTTESPSPTPSADETVRSQSRSPDQPP